MAHHKTPSAAAILAAAAGGKPTLKTIAELSGLAVPTVSRALNDAPDIGAETKALVRKLAKDIGYVPNRAGVRLRTGRTNVISLIVSTELDLMNHTPRLISAVAAGLRDTPYHLIFTPFFPDQDVMAPVRYIVETGSADGIILNQIQSDDPRVAYLLDRGVPFALHGRPDDTTHCAYYDFDNAAFGQLAVGRLVAKGRKGILLIAPPRSHAYAQHMIGGVQEAAARHDLAVEVAETVTSDCARDVVSAYIADRLSHQPRIDGIILGSASAAIATFAAVEAHGATLGQDIDICTKEAFPLLSLFRPDILTITEKVDEAGHFLADAILQAIHHPELPPMQKVDVPSADAA